MGSRTSSASLPLLEEQPSPVAAPANDLARLRLVAALEDLGVERSAAWEYVNGEADPPAEVFRALQARRAESHHDAA